MLRKFQSAPSSESQNFAQKQESCLNQVMNRIFSVSSVSAAVLACFAGLAAADDVSVTSFQEIIDATPSTQTNYSLTASSFYTITSTTDIDGTNKTVAAQSNGYFWDFISFTPTSSATTLTFRNFGNWSGSVADYVTWNADSACWTSGTCSSITTTLDGIQYGISLSGQTTAAGDQNAFVGHQVGTVRLENSVVNDLGAKLFWMDSGADLYVKDSLILKGVNSMGGSETTIYAVDQHMDYDDMIVNIDSSLWVGNSQIMMTAYVGNSQNNLVYITNSTFIGVENDGNQKYSDIALSNDPAGGPWFTGMKPSTDLVISNSKFLTYSKYTVSISALRGSVYISDSVFTSAESTASIDATFLETGSLTVRDSVFLEKGKAIVIGVDEDNTAKTTTLNIIAENTPTIFVTTGETGNWTTKSDIELGTGVTMNLNAAEGQSIQIHTGVSRASDAAASDAYPIVNINKSDVEYSYKEYEQTVENGVSTDTYTRKTATAPSGGEVQVYGAMSGLDINAYGGTIRLLPPDNPLVAGADTADRFTNSFLKDSYLTVQGDTKLKTQSVDPMEHSATTAKDQVELLMLADSIRYQTTVFGSKLTLNSNLLLEPAVDLVNAVSDTYKMADDSATVSGTGKLAVNGWIVKTDSTNKLSVTVNLAEAGDTKLASYFDITDSGKVAYGPVYIWDVEHNAGTSNYTFTRRSLEPVLTDPNVKEDIIDEIQTEIDEDKEKETDLKDSAEAGTAVADTEDKIKELENEISSLETLKDKISNMDGSSLKATPFNYNPDVYGEQVAVLGVSVIQNAIAASVFSEMRIGQLGQLIAGDKSERNEWWGKVSGADLNLKTKNFYNVEVDYALAMIGHQFNPIRTNFGNIEFGAYVGAVTANEKFSISKVKQNGGLVGGSVIYENGNAWLGAHANVGVMSNHLKGITDNKVSNPWFGLALTTGYNFVIPPAALSLAPFVDFSYTAIKAKDYTTNLGAQVRSSSLHSFEVSPGFSIDKTFGEGWGIHGQVRYAIVSKNDGKSQAKYSNGDFEALPSITNKNYVEYGAALLKHGKNWGIAMNVNRSDGGRSGWSGMARLSYRF